MTSHAPRRFRTSISETLLLAAVVACAACTFVGERDVSMSPPAVGATGLRSNAAPHPATGAGGGSPGAAAPAPKAPGGVSVQLVSTTADIPHSPPAAGHFRIHLIDVGTGLSILVQGNDFNLLFDGGSNDDRGKISDSGNNNRLLAYLYGAIGPSGPAECVPNGDTWPPRADASRLPIQHVFLSHPHNDHNSMLADVVHCYDVEDFWDSGDPYSSVVYRDLIKAISVADPPIAYHTASPVSSSLDIDGSSVSPPAIWDVFADGQVVTLGASAKLKILHSDGAPYSDANLNSTVIRLDLNGVSALLTGDAESGSREDPSAAPGDAEAFLLATYRADLDVDIMQVAHHGSMTSSRRAFLEAVTPSVALLGVGPHQYGSVVLPDASVIDALRNLNSPPQILRTDVHDAAGCPEGDRVGVDDASPAGCDNYILSF